MKTTSKQFERALEKARKKRKSDRGFRGKVKKVIERALALKDEY